MYKVPLMMLRLESDSNWYYIACSDCQTKVNRGPTSLICPKCRNVKATGVAKYCTDLSSTTMTIRLNLPYRTSCLEEEEAISATLSEQLAKD
ncbi:hypothetical protein HID58_047902 [Brassica napus]|uniref:Replication factor A C-terminal domain-containing protein n=1 Tax=Brassica napus TaxID=3708 RepID=A0ABQ8B0P1_BRANA|nr:hypothetical protein HID58_047902 [Brassica napus]